MIDKKGVLFTAIDVDDLADLVATRLKSIIAQTVHENTPDEHITLTQASRIIGKTTRTVRNYIYEGKLKNYGTGIQRPRLSRKEVVELKKEMVNGRVPGI